MNLNLIEESSFFVESYTARVGLLFKEKKTFFALLNLSIIHQELKGSCEPVLPSFPLQPKIPRSLQRSPSRDDVEPFPLFLDHCSYFSPPPCLLVQSMFSMDSRARHVVNFVSQH